MIKFYNEAATVAVAVRSGMGSASATGGKMGAALATIVCTGL